MARGALLALLWVSAADAAAARLKTDATLHARPSTTSESVGEVPAGTRVDVLSESGGWHEVKTPSGQGFIRSEYLVLGELAEPATKPAEKKADKPPPLPDTSLESVLAVSPVLLLVGGVVGWIASRVTQRRRDHRSRIRV
jgi:hypothetical protein